MRGIFMDGDQSHTEAQTRVSVDAEALNYLAKETLALEIRG